jgi:RimJ/RimL family protein N-acetyltransferase
MSIFETERLIVRAWTDDERDLARIFDIYSRSEVIRWLGNPTPLETLEQAAATQKRWGTDEQRGVWAIQAAGQVVGSVLVKNLPSSDETEVGWHLHPDAWGHGYATEAARGAIMYAFANGLDEIFAVVRPDNERSLAVCRRLGMTPLGRTTRWYDLELEAFRSRRQ